VRLSGRCYSGRGTQPDWYVPTPSPGAKQKVGKERLPACLLEITGGAKMPVATKWYFLRKLVAYYFWP
jgi:hypothetical protein